MTELTAGQAGKELTETKQAASKESRNHVRSSLFKYYIHDSTDAYRLQLLGDLTESEIAELEGCWRTARNTLGDRKLVLDLQGLKSADEPGREWLISMANEGATYLPETYLRHGFANATAASESPKPGFFCKLLRSSEVR
jgi:hypothetical protein